MKAGGEQRGEQDRPRPVVVAPCAVLFQLVQAAADGLRVDLAGVRRPLRVNVIPSLVGVSGGGAAGGAVVVSTNRRPESMPGSVPSDVLEKVAPRRS